jgi:hypothetical protein
VVDEAVDKDWGPIVEGRGEALPRAEGEGGGVPGADRRIEDQLFAVQMDQRANWDRLQDARVYERVNEEVQRSEDSSSHVWSVERGCLP